MSGDIAVFWFRRDLRLADNLGLFEATCSGLKVLPVFIFDTNILSELDRDDARVSFIHNRLSELDQKLRLTGHGLRIEFGTPEKVWQHLFEAFNIRKVFVNRDYEPYALERDERVRTLVESFGASWHSYKDQVIHETDEILKADGSPYTVFTPYKRRWLERFDKTGLPDRVTISSSALYPINEPIPTLESIGFQRSEISLRSINFNHLDDYADGRDYPGKEVTSNISPHLRFGTISIRDVIRKLDGAHPTFLSELIWREFFMQILFHFPDVIEHNFKRKYDGIQWRNNESEFERWCNGTTGYPMVDAGMRELNATGYMHNRVRMVVASFLCKHLLIDWRWGEAYFAQKLLDFELSSNNGNWQWAAGTGCDAAPYLRVFNPSEQLKKFDPGMKYVKKWVPEVLTAQYPKPMVDHAFARKRALETYKEGIE